jgi:hypothetical protein
MIFLSDLLPAAKPSGRPRSVNLWEILNAILYLLVEGVQWRRYRETYRRGRRVHLLS